MHRPAHPDIALAESQVIRRICLGRFANSPVPAASVLHIHDINAVSGNDWPTVLNPQVVHATDTLLENLRAHDRRSDRKHHSSIKLLHRFTEKPEILCRSAPNNRSAEHRMTCNNVIPNPRMNRHRNTVPEGCSQNRGVFVRVTDFNSPRW